MSGKAKGQVKATVIKAADPVISAPIKKSDAPSQVTVEEAVNAGDWIEPPMMLEGLKNMVTESSILPQCIRAYKNNIAGFGIGIRYTVDQEETPEMKAEFDAITEVVELLNVDQDTKQVFENIVEARETYGIAYLEVIRNLDKEVQQIEFIKDTPSVRKSRPMEPYVEIPYFHHGKETKRRKKFRKYKQEICGRTVYFKEFGDPRIMDLRDGRYVPEGAGLELRYQANEILEFAIGPQSYGEIRWIGQILGVDGSRMAEGLNNNYFYNGRHTPLMIMIRNGTLTDDSYSHLKEYMNDIKGENGQHGFLLLETESVDGRSDFDDDKKPEIEVKDLASILQKDELFQEYLDNNRKRVQSAFLLPDLYVGYTTDFNRATAQTAQEVTEQQVFQPERTSLAWVINNKLLNCYRFQYVEAYFLAPDISNPDDMYKLLNVTNNAGGITPNMAKEVICDALGRTCEPYTDEWGDVPLTIWKDKAAQADISGLMGQLTKQIEKAQGKNEPDQVVAVMKEVKKLLAKIQKQEENHAA